MDNVSHALIGVAIAHAALPRSARPEERTALLWASALANNLPDADIFFRPFILESGSLATLVHHRGYTHTVLLAPLLGAVAAAGARLVSGSPLSRRAWSLALAGPLIHILADSWNDYGVHPFSPFWNRWYYGDSVFILEPLLWLAFLPLAFAQAQSRGARAAWLALFLGMIGFSLAGPILTWPVAAALAAWAAAHFGAQLGLRGRRRLAAATAIASVTAMLAFFAVAGHHARALARASLSQASQPERVIQLASTPYPGNPFCWRVIAASVDGAGTYRARTGGVSLQSAWVSPESCALLRSRGHTAPWAEPSLPSGAQVKWVGEFRGSWAELQRLEGQDCRASAALRFLRVPFWTGNTEGVIGDVRYDRETGLGFAEIPWGPGLPCLPRIPPWEPPIHRVPGA